MVTTQTARQWARRPRLFWRMVKYSSFAQRSAKHLDYDAAIRFQEQALEIIAELHGLHHTFYLNGLSELGLYYQRNDDKRSAKRVYEELIGLTNATDDVDEAVRGIKFLIAKWSIDWEEWDAAERLLIELVNSQPQPSGFGNASQAAFLLAGVYNHLGKIKKAAERYRQSLELMRQTSNSTKVDEAWIYREWGLMAIIHNDVGLYAEAETYLRKALNLLAGCEQRKTDDFATIWQDLISLHVRTGNLARAEEAAHQSLAAIRTVTNENDPLLTEHLHTLSKLMIGVGRYALALDFAQRELVLLQQQVAPSNLQIAGTLERLGDTFTTLHRVQEATTHYEEALAICTVNGEAGATLKKNVEQSLRWLRIQSGLAAESGEDTAQKNKLDLEINEPDQAGSFEDFCARCMSYLNAGAHQEANDLVQRMVERSRRHPDSSERGSILQFAGSIWHRLGKYSEAEQAYLEALKILEASEVDDPKRGEDYQIVSLIYHNLGGLYYETGRVADSERIRRRSRELAHSTSLDNPDALVKELNELSILSMTVGDLAEAESYLEEAGGILQNQKIDAPLLYGQVLNNLATIKLAREKWFEANKTAMKAEEILREYGPDTQEYASTQATLGKISAAIGDFLGAKEHFSNAIQILDQLVGQTHVKTKTAHGFLATLYWWEGLYAKAEGEFEVALSAYAGKSLSRAQSESMTYRSLGLVALGKNDEALDCLRQAIVQDDRLIHNAFAFSTEKQRMQVVATAQIRFHALLAMACIVFRENPDVVQQTLTAVLRRKALGVEALVVQREAVLSGRYTDSAPMLEQLSRLKQNIASLIWGQSDEDPDAITQQIDEMERRDASIEAELARHITEFRLEQKLNSVSYDTVSNILQPGSMLIEFVRQQGIVSPERTGLEPFALTRYLAFAVPAQASDAIQLFDLGDAEEIDQLIHSFLQLLTDSPDNLPDLSRHLTPVPSKHKDSSLSDYDRIGKRLYEVLVKPWLDILGDREQLFLSLDGELSLLPFEVLPIGPDQFMIDHYTTVYLGSGRDLLRYQPESVEPRSRRPTYLIAAGPDFDLKATGESLTEHLGTVETTNRTLTTDIKNQLRFEPLEGAQIEGRIVAELLGTTPLIGKDVLKKPIRAMLESRSEKLPPPAVLHFATHGFFLHLQENALTRHVPETYPTTEGKVMMPTEGRLANPLLRSCLALAGANTAFCGEELPSEAEDGILTALYISGLDLSQTELVVLSACQTGVGDIQIGEGVWGLRRAFELAGAKALVVSLWAVDDHLTRDLMKAFYEGLIAGQPCAQALRNDRLALRQSPGRASSPSYWGAFICQGNPGPVASLQSRQTPVVAT